MSSKFQALALTFLVLISVALTKSAYDVGEQPEPQKVAVAEVAKSVEPPAFAFQPTSPDNEEKDSGPIRKWDVLDPEIKAQAALIQSLDDGTTFLSYNTDKIWPAASLTKLLTATVVIEDIGLSKKVPVSKTATQAYDGSDIGGLKAGDVYAARDLLKIMLLTSSNQAAAAFEEYLGGRDYFVKAMRDKALKIGMSRSVFYGAAGYESTNESTAGDLLKLARYVIGEHPDIMAWTRLRDLIVQPVNTTVTRTVYNINPLVDSAKFLGGKTGTTPEARQNLIAVFSQDEMRLIVIILGSEDRVKEANRLTEWVNKAYTF